VHCRRGKKNNDDYDDGDNEIGVACAASNDTSTKRHFNRLERKKIMCFLATGADTVPARSITEDVSLDSDVGSRGFEKCGGSNGSSNNGSGNGGSNDRAMAAKVEAMAEAVIVLWRHHSILFHRIMFSFSRLPSWQEDLTVAIRGRLCRLCVRALFKMALSVAAQ